MQSPPSAKWSVPTLAGGEAAGSQRAGSGISRPGREFDRVLLKLLDAFVPEVGCLFLHTPVSPRYTDTPAAMVTSRPPPRLYPERGAAPRDFRGTCSVFFPISNKGGESPPRLIRWPICSTWVAKSVTRYLPTYSSVTKRKYPFQTTRPSLYGWARPIAEVQALGRVGWLCTSSREILFVRRRALLASSNRRVPARETCLSMPVNMYST